MECSCTYCFSYVIETFLGMKCDEGEVVIGDRSKIWPFVKMLSTPSTYAFSANPSVRLSRNLFVKLFSRPFFEQNYI